MAIADSNEYKIQCERRVLMKGMGYRHSDTSVLSFKDAFVKAFEELRTKSLLENMENS